jgi:predicted helicase
VSNNSFVDQIAFDGMRKHLFSDFSQLYHLHLEGNVRHNPTLSGTAYNVFGIQVGVGITVAIRRREGTGALAQQSERLMFFRVDKKLRRREKLDWLAQHLTLGSTPWKPLSPDGKHTWLVPEHSSAYDLFRPIGMICPTYSVAVKTNRDETVYDFHRENVTRRVKVLIDEYNAEVDRYRRALQEGRIGKQATKEAQRDELDRFVRYDKIKWSRDLKADLQRGRSARYDDAKLRTCLYRPFCKRFLFFDRILNEEVYAFPELFPSPACEGENRAIAVTGIGAEKPFMTMVVETIVDLHLVGSGAAAQCFPFYTYAEDGSNRRENITDWALEQFRTHYADPAIGKWDIFYYVYGILHHPGYRTKFADNLKRELPRIPFAPAIANAGVRAGSVSDGLGRTVAHASGSDLASTCSGFWAFANAGRELAALHLDYEKLEPHPLKWIETEGVPLSYRVDDKMRLSKDKTSLKVNPSLTLAGIPPETFNYRLGNRSALEWVIDQYQVSEDKRSGIQSDPNRQGDEEYIIRLVGQVVRVSLETVRIVSGLPEQYAGVPARA